MKLITTTTCSLALGVFCLSMAAMASAVRQAGGDLDHQNIKDAQQSLSDKGLYHARVDGLIGSQTRASIGQYQRWKAAGHRATGCRDGGQTGSGNGIDRRQLRRGRARDVRAAGGLGHEIKEGKPLAAGKEFGKGMGRAGDKFGKGVKKAVSTESDRGDREKKQ